MRLKLQEMHPSPAIYIEKKETVGYEWLYDDVCVNKMNGVIN